MNRLQALTCFDSHATHVYRKLRRCCHAAVQPWVRKQIFLGAYKYARMAVLLFRKYDQAGEHDDLLCPMEAVMETLAECIRGEMFDPHFALSAMHHLGEAGYVDVDQELISLN